MQDVKNWIKLLLTKHRWKQRNKHNYTGITSVFDITRVSVGQKTYGDLNINLGTNPNRIIKIGHFCSIAPEVKFIVNPHNYRFFSSWGWQIFEYNERCYEWEKKTAIIVEDDVWIGQGSIILGGAILHQGCVIGAGTVVTGEIPPYAIYANHKIIGYRFELDVRKKLVSIDYAKFDQCTIDKIRGWHKVELNESNVDEFMKLVPIKE